jgi:hypothetical protein
MLNENLTENSKLNIIKWTHPNMNHKFIFIKSSLFVNELFKSIDEKETYLHSDRPIK